MKCASKSLSCIFSTLYNAYSASEAQSCKFLLAVQNKLQRNYSGSREGPASMVLIIAYTPYYWIHETLAMKLLKLQHWSPQDAETANNKNRLTTDHSKFMSKEPPLLFECDDSTGNLHPRNS